MMICEEMRVASAVSARTLRRANPGGALLALLAALALASGCAAPGLDRAREHFYAGDPGRAEDALAEIGTHGKDRVLMLMERGMARQALGDYEGSSEDWERAAQEAEYLDYYSVSRGSASLVSNDRVFPFRGAPYERVLLHALNAQNYLARAMWDDAAVEARCIVDRLADLNGFPDDPFSHYVAAFCLELADDSEGAAFQYRKTSELLTGLHVDQHTGRIATSRAALSSGPRPAGAELVCFMAVTRAPVSDDAWPDRDAFFSSPYAEIHANGRKLGRSYALTDTRELYMHTRERTAALRAAKTGARIVLKDAIADMVTEEEEWLGELLRVILFALEVPDNRRWETLPRALHVARVDCPPDLDAYEVVFRNTHGRIIGRRTVTAPLTRRRNTFVSFCRDL